MAVVAVARRLAGLGQAHLEGKLVDADGLGTLQPRRVVLRDGDLDELTDLGPAQPRFAERLVDRGQVGKRHTGCEQLARLAPADAETTDGVVHDRVVPGELVQPALVDVAQVERHHPVSEPRGRDRDADAPLDLLS